MGKNTMITRLNEKGFSLIELIIVIAIIGVLAAIAIPQFSSYRTRSYNATAMADLRSAATAQEAYHVNNQIYAGSLNLTQDYGLTTSTGVELTVSGSSSSYTITSYHSSGNKTYTLAGPGGTIGDI